MKGGGVTTKVDDYSTVFVSSALMLMLLLVLGLVPCSNFKARGNNSRRCVDIVKDIRDIHKEWCAWQRKWNNNLEQLEGGGWCRCRGAARAGYR